MKAKLTFDIVSLFPEMFQGPLTQSILGRAQKAGFIKVNLHNFRDWSDDPRHQKVDDRPYGGGAGMVIRPEPVYQALKSLGAVSAQLKKVSRKGKDRPLVILMSPQGPTLSQAKAERLAKRGRIILLCGHYEGFDERVMEWADEEVSIGDYVLTGGELPAMVLVDVVSRLVPGVVGDSDSVKNESFSSGILDYPHYTRPQSWRGRSVPPVLLSGNHRDIERWRKDTALRITRAKKPSLLTKSR